MQPPFQRHGLPGVRSYASVDNVEVENKNVLTTGHDCLICAAAYIKMVQTKGGASNSSYLQYMKDCAKKYKELKAAGLIVPWAEGPPESTCNSTQTHEDADPQHGSTEALRDGEAHATPHYKT